MSVALLGSVLGGGLGFIFGVVMARMLRQNDFGLMVLAVNLLTVRASRDDRRGRLRRRFAMSRPPRTPGAKRGAMVAPIRLAMG